MIGLAAVIAAATAVGVGAERRFGAGAELVARRALWAMLWLALPVIAFFNIAALELTGELGAGIGFAYAGQLAGLGLAYGVGTWVLGLPRHGVGALMVVAAFGNTGYLGLPFSAALFGLDEVPQAVTYDVIVSGIGAITVGFSVGAAFGTRAGERLRQRVTGFFLRNPPLLASLAGFAAPEALAPQWAVEASQGLAVGLLLPGFFAIGVVLAAGGERGAFRFPPRLTAPVGAALAIKLLAVPGVVLALSAALEDVPDSYLTQSAMASALSTMLIANEYGLDRDIAAGAIAWSTLVVVAAGVVASPGFG